ncbi:MAG: CU044_2847 family protein [Stackebrandtia sp.]
MYQAVPVRIGSAEFLVETVTAPEEVDATTAPDDDGGLDGETTPIADAPHQQAETFDRVREMIEAISGELVAAWEKSRPAEATVEFGIAADVKAGKLTGLLVGGGAAASLKVTLKWTSTSGQ